MCAGEVENGVNRRINGVDELVAETRPLELIPVTRIRYVGDRRSQETRRCARRSAAKPPLGVVPGYDCGIAAIELVEPPVKHLLLSRGDVQRLGPGTQAVPEVSDEGEALLRGELVDVDRWCTHGSMIRPTPYQNQTEFLLWRRPQITYSPRMP